MWLKLLIRTELLEAHPVQGHIRGNLYRDMGGQRSCWRSRLALGEPGEGMEGKLSSMLVFPYLVATYRILFMDRNVARACT